MCSIWFLGIRLSFLLAMELEDAVFDVFDGDAHALVGVPCTTLVSAAKAENAGFYPDELIALKGRKLLFKVEKTSVASVLFDGSFRVKRSITLTKEISHLCLISPVHLQF